jgi:hypothetical protein
VLSVCLGLILLNGTMAWGEMLSVKAVLTPKELIYADLPTAEKHVIYFVKREGKAVGIGILDGVELAEYGTYDIRPGVDGSARGYLVARFVGGEQLVIQWEDQATAVPGADKSDQLLHNGVWRVLSGTGSRATTRGAGILHIRRVAPRVREFSLEGQVVTGKP